MEIYKKKLIIYEYFFKIYKIYLKYIKVSYKIHIKCV